MGDESVDTCFDNCVVEMMAHRMGSRSMFMSDAAGVEKFVKVGFIRYFRIDDVAMEKHTAVKSQVMFVPLELFIGLS